MTTHLHILSLQPYFGGSHQSFMENLAASSRHKWSVLSLPPRKWKWRMRHAALTFADMLNRHPISDYELVFCSDMLNLAEFRALAPHAIGRLPCVMYFHENQFAYPAQTPEQEKENTVFGFINMVGAMAADDVWFNSAYNLHSFFEGAKAHLRKMPDFRPFSQLSGLRRRCTVMYPGITIPEVHSAPRPAGPLRILWAARWEHDKGPEDFFEALTLLSRRKVPFRLNVVGQNFERVPEVFVRARQQFASRIDTWGYQPTREAYLEVLRSSDVIVSTAYHEFFGLSVMEAAASGVRPLLPQRLVYPELFAGLNDVFYDGTIDELADKLAELAAVKNREGRIPDLRESTTTAEAGKYAWPIRAAAMDARLERAAGR